jgi:hypothetical protein
MGLLLATSFLNLRRYLRRRKVRMPAAMTATWLTTGGVVIVGLTLLAALLPLPGSGLSVLRGSTSESSDLRASRLALLKDGGVQGEGAQSEGPAASKAKGAPASPNKPQGSGQTNDPNARQQTSGKGRPGGSQGQGNARRGSAGGKASPSKGGTPGKQGRGEQGETGNQSKDQNGSAEKQADRDQDANQGSSPDNKNASNENDGNSSQENRDSNDAARPPTRLPSPPFQVPSWLRGLVTVVGVVGLIFCLFRYGPFLLDALRDLLASLFGGIWIGKPKKRAKDSAAESTEPARPARPFASFLNPFASGLVQRLSPNDLVIYSFEALEAWAFEHNLARSPHETPTEFVRRLGQARDDLRQDSTRLVGFFVSVVYGQRGFRENVLPVLEQFWAALESSAA